MKKRTRRNYGMGSIVKRGTRWALVRSLGRNPENGKYRQRWYYYGTKDEARAAQLKLKLHTSSGGSLPSVRLTLGGYLEEWLRIYTVNLAPATRKSYEDTAKKHLVPELGSRPLAKLSAQHIQDYIADRLTRKLSSTSVRYHAMLLHEVLEQAVRDGHMMRNPIDFVKLPRRARPEMKVLDEEQARLFLAGAKRSSLHYRLYLTAMLTGLREGELLGLRWQDVDLTTGRATVRQTMYRMSGAKKRGFQTVVFKAPKSAKSVRSVPLPPVLVEELRKARREQDECRRQFGSDYTDSDLVFCQANGRPLHAGNLLRRDFREILKRAKLPRVRFHDLRHSFATHWLQEGGNIRVLSEQMGHSTPAFTLSVYSHSLPGVQEEIAHAVAARLLGTVEVTTNLPVATKP